MAVVTKNDRWREWTKGVIHLRFASHFIDVNRSILFIADGIRTPRSSRLYFVRLSFNLSVATPAFVSIICYTHCSLLEAHSLFAHWRRDGERIDRSEFENRNRCSVHAHICDTYSTNTAGEYQQMNTCLSPVSDSVDRERRVRLLQHSERSASRLSISFWCNLSFHTFAGRRARLLSIRLLSPRLVVHDDGWTMLAVARKTCFDSRQTIPS